VVRSAWRWRPADPHPLRADGRELGGEIAADVQKFDHPSS
jgi:hypothetical protein